MASPTQWTWVWPDSRSWWWKWRHDVLQSMGSQRVRHDWAIELNWTDPVSSWYWAQQIQPSCTFAILFLSLFLLYFSSQWFGFSVLVKVHFHIPVGHLCSLGKCLFSSTVQFLIWLFVFWLLSCMRCWYILDSKPISENRFVNISLGWFYIVWWFPLLWKSFAF